MDPAAGSSVSSPPSRVGQSGDVVLLQTDSACCWLSRMSVCVDGAPVSHGDPCWQPLVAAGKVDADKVPYMVLTPAARALLGPLGARLLDLGAIVDLDSGKWTEAIWAENAGTGNHLGEASSASAVAVGYSPSPIHGGTSALRVGYWLAPGSGKHRIYDGWRADARGLFERWGGVARLREVLRGG